MLLFFGFGLCAQHFRCKVSDFGMSRTLKEGEVSMTVQPGYLLSSPCCCFVVLLFSLGSFPLLSILVSETNTVTVTNIFELTKQNFCLLLCVQQSSVDGTRGSESQLTL